MHAYLEDFFTGSELGDYQPVAQLFGKYSTPAGATVSWPAKARCAARRSSDNARYTEITAYAMNYACVLIMLFHREPRINFPAVPDCGTR